MKLLDKDLSIVIITMNRKRQVIEAIDSCCSCTLPNKTEFVIVDNGSNDGTEQAINDLFEKVAIPYQYIKMPCNVGASEGRNIGRKHAKGKYAYYLDDDAIINPDYIDNFFVLPLKYLDDHPKVAILSTVVYDECLNAWREVRKGRSYSYDYPNIFEFHGNTYFIRNELDELDYAPTIKYGFEEVFVSIKVMDKGYINGLYTEVGTIHRPEINKWIEGSKELREITVKGNAGMLSVKYLLYPKIYIPVLYFGFLFRCIKHMKMDFKNYKKSYLLFRAQTNGIKVEKIKNKTIFTIFREFGFGATV